MEQNLIQLKLLQLLSYMQENVNGCDWERMNSLNCLIMAGFNFAKMLVVVFFTAAIFGM